MATDPEKPTAATASDADELKEESLDEVSGGSGTDYQDPYANF